MVKKSLYVFMTAVMGMLLFLVLDRICVFIYLYFVSAGIGAGSFNYGNFVIWDLFLLIVTVVSGIWYGIWVGLGWFEQIYESGLHGGFIDYLVKYHWPTKPSNHLESKMKHVRRELEKNLLQFEDLADAAVAQQPEPKVSRQFRKRTVRKTKVPSKE